jgi:hypothetical protein
MIRDGDPPLLYYVNKATWFVEMRRTLNSGELCEVIHNRFCCMNVVIDEWFTFLDASFT